MCSSLLSSVFPVFVCRIPVVSKEIQSQPFSNEDTAPRAPFLVTAPTVLRSRRRSELSVFFSHHFLISSSILSFFDRSSRISVFSTVYDRNTVPTFDVSYVPYEIFQNF